MLLVTLFYIVSLYRSVITETCRNKALMLQRLLILVQLYCCESILPFFRYLERQFTRFFSSRRHSRKVVGIFVASCLVASKNYWRLLSKDEVSWMAINTESNIPNDKPTTISSKNDPNRTMVVLLGNLRCGERAWNTLLTHVLDVNHADLCVITQTPPQRYIQNSLFQRAKYVEIVPDFTDWGDALDLMEHSTSWRNRILPLYHPNNILLGGVGNISGSGAIIFWYRWYLSKLIVKYQWIQRYDRFVITRNDHYYACPHHLDMLNHSYLWLPSGEDYQGLTDRHLVVSNTHVLQALDILPPMLTHPDRYQRSLTKSNSEQFLKRRYTEEGLLPLVRRFRRVMFTCSQTGDASRGAPLRHESVPEGVRLKYPTEYQASMDTCHHNHSSMVLDHCKYLYRCSSQPKLAGTPVVDDQGAKRTGTPRNDKAGDTFTSA
jgi:hypothetical protein